MGLVENHRRGKWNYYFIAKQQPDVVKHHLAALKNVQAYREIFTHEMQPLMDKLLPRPKTRK